MTCYHPLYATKCSQMLNAKSGKPTVFVHQAYENFKKPPILGDFINGSYNYTGFLIPCGQCIGCRLNYSRMWAIRLMKEVPYHSTACFITLTYSDDNLVFGEERPTLVKKHFQDFIKRLRSAVSYDYPDNEKLKFFHCGEYGSKTLRPHYHAILFGFDFPDKQLLYSKGGYPHYVSEYLNKIWGKGLCEVCNVSFDTCAYVARYIMKKVKGVTAENFYKGFQPEYITMSNGIGKSWFDDFKFDVYNNDDMIHYIDGRPIHLRPPRYFDNLFDVENPEQFAKIKAKRQQALLAKPFEPKRLQVKEKIKIIKTKDLKRSLEL